VDASPPSAGSASGVRRFERAAGLSRPTRDFALVMIVRDMDECTNRPREMFFASNNVKRFKSLVGMRRQMVTLDVLVP
jgi:hypothetical protein